jgi:putative ABC transport system substrate-binding protein
MKRREFITLLGGAAAWPRAARSQQPDKTARVGWLAASLDNPVQAVGREVLLSTLRKLGFTEGYNLVLEHRRTDEGMAKAFAGANELVAAKADVLIADGPEIALQAATAARPIVPVVMLANNYNRAATSELLRSRGAMSLAYSTDSRSWPQSNSNC